MHWAPVCATRASSSASIVCGDGCRPTSGSRSPTYGPNATQRSGAPADAGRAGASNTAIATSRPASHRPPTRHHLVALRDSPCILHLAWHGTWRRAPPSDDGGAPAAWARGASVPPDKPAGKRLDEGGPFLHATTTKPPRGPDADRQWGRRRRPTGVAPARRGCPGATCRLVGGPEANSLNEPWGDLEQAIPVNWSGLPGSDRREVLLCGSDCAEPWPGA